MAARQGINLVNILIGALLLYAIYYFFVGRLEGFFNYLPVGAKCTENTDCDTAFCARGKCVSSYP
jgi:hypothetical protein